MSHSRSHDPLCSSSFAGRFGWKSFFQRDRWSTRGRRSDGGVGCSGSRQPRQHDQSSFQLHSQIKAEYRRRASLSRHSLRKPEPTSERESPDEGLLPIAFAILHRRKQGRASKRDLDFHPLRRTVLQTDLERRGELRHQSPAIHGRIGQHRIAWPAGASKGIP